VEEYRVQLDAYSGPLDLMLFLIRREEIDIYDIPIARLTQQYLAYVQLLERLDPDFAADFLVMAATLMEIKSRALLPRPPAAEEDEEDWADPRMELVRQLLAYKSFRDAARELELAAQIQALKHPRQPATPDTEPEAIELEDVQIWDLLEAFQKLLDETGQGEPFHEVQVDDTPISLYADDILDSLQRAGGVQLFAEVFAGRDRAEMIGLFLALLELVRERRIRVSQDEPLGGIVLHLLDATPIYGASLYSYEHPPASDGHSAPHGERDEWGKGIPDTLFEPDVQPGDAIRAAPAMRRAADEGEESGDASADVAKTGSDDGPGILRAADRDARVVETPEAGVREVEPGEVGATRGGIGAARVEAPSLHAPLGAGDPGDSDISRETDDAAKSEN